MSDTRKSQVLKDKKKLDTWWARLRMAAILRWEEKLVLVMVMGSLWTDMLVVVVEPLSRMLCCEPVLPPLVVVGCDRGGGDRAA